MVWNTHDKDRTFGIPEVSKKGRVILAWIRLDASGGAAAAILRELTCGTLQLPTGPGVSWQLYAPQSDEALEHQVSNAGASLL